MGDDGDGFELFDFDDDAGTIVDSSFWNQQEIPDYPPLAHFGRFEILGRIARGGMAEVFLAREWDDNRKARHLVVKRVLPEMEGNPQLLQMFLDEGKTASRLYHPNVCHVYESGEIDGATFMTLEWVWGTSLDDAITAARKRDACIPWPIAIEVVAQVAAALHYVHHAKGVAGKSLNIVHRDVSPHNVMISWRGGVKLLDFGIAKTSQETTTGGGFVGKYGYMSPEQAQSRRVDPRSDIFALGIVLFEALTGKPLYERQTLLETLSAIVREPVPSLLEERPELPVALEAIAQRALAKDPNHRFQSAGEMKAALSQVIRAQNQVVNDQRIRIFLDGMFDEATKLPLQPGSDNLSGAFGALTKEGAAVTAAEKVVTYQTFDHSGEDDPIVLGSHEGTSPWVWVGVALLGVLMAVMGAAAALFVLS